MKSRPLAMRQPTADLPVGSQSSELDSIVDEISDRLGRGEAVDFEEYCRTYPNYAECLKQLQPLMVTMTMLAEESDPLGEDATRTQPARTLGDFRLIRQIGRGGMGMIYEAEQLSLERRVAVKILPLASVLDPIRLRRFKNEALAAGGLDHPHIVPVYAVGCERGIHFYAMRLIQGESLADWIARQRPEAQSLTSDEHHDAAKVSPDAETVPLAAISTQQPANSQRYFLQVGRWGLQAAQALQHAHHAGLVHRDIKPSNLLIDDNFQLWVTDFGLAQLPGDTQMTMTGDILGTLRYMSPEQALGRPGIVDQRADVYSLGATLYELTTFQPAVPGHDRQVILNQIATLEPVPPHRLATKLPHDLETIILKALAKQPGDRYATAELMADDLQRFIDGRPITARRPTVIQRTGKWIVRHRAIVATAAACLMFSFIVGLVLITRAYQSERSQRQLAEAERSQAHANLILARSVVDDMYVRVAEDWLENQPHATGVQRELLEKAAEFYDALPIVAEGDREARRQSALVKSRVAQLRCNMGQFDLATKAFQRCVSLYDAIVNDEEHPDPEDVRLLANALTQLGSHIAQCSDAKYLYDTPSARQTAIDAMLRSRELLTSLMTVFPDDTEIQRDLAKLYAGLTALYRESQQLKLAEEMGSQAVERAETALAQEPDHADGLEQLAKSCREYHLTLVKLGQHDKAESIIRLAVAAAEQASAQHPNNQNYRALHVVCLMNLGTSLHQGRTDFSEIPVMEQAVALNEQLAQQFPDMANYSGNLRILHSNLSVVYRDRSASEHGNHDADLDQAIMHIESLIRPEQLDLEERLSDHEKQDELLTDVGRLGELLAEAGRSPDSSQKLLDLWDWSDQQIQKHQQAVDASPDDAEMRFQLYRVLAFTSQMKNMGGAKESSEELFDRAQVVLTTRPAAPDIEGIDAFGQSMRLSSYRGKVVVLDFFNDSCPLCNDIFPIERRVAEAYRERPFAVLGVSSNSQGRLQEMMRQGKIAWPSWHDPSPALPIIRHWYANGFPCVFLIDHQGQIRQRFTDVPDEDEFVEAIEQLVREAEASLPPAQQIAIDVSPVGSGQLTRRKLMHEVPIVPFGAQWRYLADDSDPGEAWASPSFDDGAWQVGPAELGFGDEDEQTVIANGLLGTLLRKASIATAYFRHDFTAPELKAESLQIALVADDGAVVYLNGQEIVRSKVPTTIGRKGYTDIDGGDNAFSQHTVPSTLLRPGSNLLAAAVYQRTPDSSDMSFNLRLTAHLQQSLPVLHFGDLVGNGHGQLPTDTNLRSAHLVITVPTSTPDFDVRHIIDSGVSPTVVVRKIDSDEPGSRTFDVKDSVVRWVTGQPNEGWAIVTTSGESVDDDTFQPLQARLVVTYWPAPSAASALAASQYDF